MTNNFEATLLSRDQDKFNHKIDTRKAPRISEEVVERIDEDGRKVFGEVIATFGSGAEEDFDSTASLIDDYSTLCIVRYDDKSVGIASRAYLGDTPVLHPGHVLEVDHMVYFGRFGDTDANESVVMNRAEVLGRKALSGLSSSFEPTVSRIQGSLMLWPDGTLTITDGYEYADPQTRAVIDKPSGNGTKVHTARASAQVDRRDIITPLKDKEKAEEREQRFIEIFGVPQQQPRDRFGNIQDRVSLITDESEQEAAQVISAIKDSNLQSIIEEHTQGLIGQEIVRKIRSDESTRVEIAKYLMKKVEEGADLMPDRVMRRGEKGANHPGYPGKLSTKEYASLLAISMLDGTFISKRSLSDPVEFVSHGNQTDINGGQHRLAALRLLELDHNTSPKLIEQVRTYR